jgi:hypothetical protein
MQKYNLQKKKKNPLEKKPKSFKILYNSVTNLKFQHKPKISYFKKSSYIKKNLLLLLLLLPRGQNITV